MDENQNVEDAQIVPKAVDDLFTIQDSIKSRMSSLEKIREQIKTQREMLASYLENDPKYREATEVAKKASQQKTGIKNQLLKQPEAANLNATIKSLKEQQQELDEGLSYYLREYQRITGANEFEGDDGELRQIVYVAKLVRKTNFKK